MDEPDITTTDAEEVTPVAKRKGMGCFGKTALVLIALVVALGVIWYAWLVGATNRRDAAWEQMRAAGIATSAQELKAQIQPVEQVLNPALVYEDAISLMDEGNEAWMAWDNYEIPEGARSPEEEAVFAALERAMVEAHADPLEVMAEADDRIRPAVDRVRADFGVWSERKGPLPPDILSVMLPDLTTVRSLARLLAADASVAGADGEGEQVVRANIRIIGMADAVDSDAHTLVEHLVAVGIRALGATTVIKNAGAAAGAPQELKATLTQLLLDNAPGTAGFRAGMAGESTMQQAIMAELDNSRMALNALTTPGGGITALQPILRPIMRDDAAEMATYMLSVVGAADGERFPDARDALPDMGFDERSTWSDMFLLILLPSLDRAVEAEFRSRTDRYLAAVTLAIHSYKRDNGQLPPDLAALVPDYLPAVPIDPMAATGDLRYDASRGIVWSVGTDGVDDGGDQTNVQRGVPNRWSTKDVVIEVTPEP